MRERESKRENKRARQRARETEREESGSENTAGPAPTCQSPPGSEPGLAETGGGEDENQKTLVQANL